MSEIKDYNIVLEYIFDFIANDPYFPVTREDPMFAPRFPESMFFSNRKHDGKLQELFDKFRKDATV